MMSVSIGSDGFTDVGRSGDTRTVYVSSSGGSDSNNGLSADRPVRSIKKGMSLLRDHMPDHLLLKRGDAWGESVTGWSKSGRSGSEPMVFGSYGTGSRPLIKTGSAIGFESAGSVDHLAILGVHFWAHSREPGAGGFTSAGTYGIRFVAGTSGLLIEDTVIDQYAQNVLLSGAHGDQRNIRIRRSVITDAWSTSGKAQGIYASRVNGLTLEDNVFDHNGWNERASGGKATPLSHNVYIAADVDNFAARGNVFADAASHGLQARAGGDVRDNLFVRNPIHLSFGLVNGSAIKPGGVAGTVDGNVFIGTRTINGSTRGWAMELGNIRGATVRNNIISKDNDTDGSAAINLGYGENVSNASSGVGINNLTLENNVVYRWTQSLGLDDNLRPGGSGYTSLNNLTVRGNEFQYANKEFHKLISHRMPVNRGEEFWSNNRYYEDADEKYWFGFYGDETSLDDWRDKLEPTAQAAKIGYSNPERDVVSYQQSVGGSASLAGFLSAARKVSSADWSGRFTARAVVNHVRAGFNKSGTSTSGGTTTGSDTTQPRVTGYSGSGTSVKIRFSENVGASLTAKDLWLGHAATGNRVYDSLRLSYNSSTNEATWTWSSLGTLTRGTWQARLPDEAVSDAAGNRLAGGKDFTFSFYV